MTGEHGHTEPVNDSEITVHIYRGIEIVKETLKFCDICDFAHSSVFDDRYIVPITSRDTISYSNRTTRKGAGTYSTANISICHTTTYTRSVMR